MRTSAGVELFRTLAIGTLRAHEGSLFAQPPTGLGSEFQVNQYTTGFQTLPAVALDADGDFVVVWQSHLQDGSYAGVFGRRFASTGAPLAGELQVNSFTTGYQAGPAVAPDADGDFVIVWEGEGEADSSGVFARRFNAPGVPQAGEFLVNTYTSSNQARPDVSMSGNGAFVVIWQSEGQDGSNEGVFGRRFNAAGSPLAAEFRVNSQTMFAQRNPVVGVDDEGDLVVAWESVGGQDGGSTGVFAQRFDSVGVAVAGEFQVNLRTVNAQTYPAVGVDQNGDFVVVWQSYQQEGSDYGIFGRRFTSTDRRWLGSSRPTSTPPPASAGLRSESMTPATSS
jgi:hypothetical protein